MAVGGDEDGAGNVAGPEDGEAAVEDSGVDTLMTGAVVVGVAPEITVPVIAAPCGTMICWPGVTDPTFTGVVEGFEKTVLVGVSGASIGVPPHGS